MKIHCQSMDHTKLSEISHQEKESNENMRKKTKMTKTKNTMLLFMMKVLFAYIKQIFDP